MDLINIIESSKSDITVISGLLFLISLCILKIVHNVYFAPKYLQGYTAMIFIVLFMSFVIGYQQVYESKEYVSAYEKLNHIKTKIDSLYNKEDLKRLESVNDLIITSLEDNKITAKEYDYILDRYLIIVEILEEEKESEITNSVTAKQKLKSKL